MARSIKHSLRHCPLIENAAGLQSPAPQPNHTTAPAPEDSVMADSSDTEEPATNGQIVPLDSQEVNFRLSLAQLQPQSFNVAR